MEFVGRVIADSGEDVLEVIIDIQAVTLGRLGYRKQDRRGFAAVVAAEKQPVLAAQSYGPHEIFRYIIGPSRQKHLM